MRATGVVAVVVVVVVVGVVVVANVTAIKNSVGDVAVVIIIK